ncbi:BTAD domain-containing putative transcriptional regulator [Peterkaempfera sp. SMS 1(5)a]|uniref:AfsR/SARP family transcriptional regulator n=1 Tax=Peterkaempfera podocarpi TaxID=3232308 RepID=UPI0036714748
MNGAALRLRPPTTSQHGRGRAARPGAPSGRPGAHITVLGGFDLRVGQVPVAVPTGSQRVLAFVALCCQAAVPRALVAGTLWPEAPEHCAHANFRSALARLHSEGRRALEIGPAEVRLAGGTSVDLHHARRIAHRILDPDTAAGDPERDLAAVDALSVDLLPGWYDDWAQLEAEDWRQLRLHALERLAEQLIGARRYAAAVAAARAAVHADPLRESAQSCLIQAHLAERNPSEALDAFARYGRRLRAELGLDPTPDLRQLVTGLSPGGARCPGHAPATRR